MECETLCFIFYLLICNTFSLAMVSVNSGRNDSSETLANASWSSDGVPDFRSLCPYNKYCTSQPLKHNPSTELTSCCQQCSCEIDCYEIGNCCPDVPFSPADKVKYPCESLLGDSMYTNLWYHVIAKCKDLLNALSHPRCYNPTELQDLIVVSNPTNGRVYKNRHCAICNNVHDYTKWKLQTYCPDTLQFEFQTFADGEKHIFENREKCPVYSLTPDSKAGEMSRCFSDWAMLRKCNISGEWDFYDKGIEDACLLNRENQNVIFTDESEQTSLYANVYCYLCNTPRRMTKSDLCLRDPDDGDRKSMGVPFTGIIDIRTNDNKEPDDFDCKSHEIWDPFSRSCRHLTCPAGTLPLHGSCRSILSQSEGYTTLINFEVLFNNQNVTVTSIALLSLLERSVLPKFGSGCSLPQSALLRVAGFSNIIFELKVASTKACPAETILANTRKLGMKNNIRVRYRYKNNIFHISLSIVFGHISVEDVLAINSYETPKRIHRTINSTILHYCPSIKLTRHEFYSLGLNNSLEISSTDSDYKSEILSVCVDNYFQARRASSGIMSNHHYTYHWCLFHTLSILTSKYFMLR